VLPILGEQKCASIFSCRVLGKVVLSQSSSDDGDTLLYLNEIDSGKLEKRKAIVNIWYF
jgi:hypothetical protein